MMIANAGPGPLKIIAPTQHTAGLANGASIQVTSTLEMTLIQGGLRPYTYDWTDNGANVFIQASSSVTTMVRSTGTNSENNGSHIFILTQANGAATTVSINYTYVHGTL